MSERLWLRVSDALNLDAGWYEEAYEHGEVGRLIHPPTVPNRALCLPDEAWSYIGWADEHWVWDFFSKDYARAEEIMQRALARPRLNDRRDVLERLEEMYGEWGKPDRAAEMRAQLRQPEEKAVRPVSRPPSPPVPVSRAPVIKAPRPGRNDPCWCASGRKYKHCHLRADEEQERGR